jgi:hypothetical protein
VFVEVLVSVLVAVKDGVDVTVIVMVPVVVSNNCNKVFGVRDTWTILGSLGVLVRIGVTVGDAVEVGKGVAGITGAGTKIIPKAPIINRANPLVKLITNSLGYAIRIKKSN